VEKEADNFKTVKKNPIHYSNSESDFFFWY
jgi:hypothetical protein